MFRKAHAEASCGTVVSAGSALQGNLRIKGPLRIEGAVYGNVTTDGHMSVGPEGRILGEVRAHSLTVAGRIDGIALVQHHLLVLRTGVMRGHARYQSLEIERGGVMDGTTSLADDTPSDSEQGEESYAAAE